MFVFDVFVGAAVIQPALLTGGATPKKPSSHWWRVLLIVVAVLLTFSAAILTYKLYVYRVQTQVCRVTISFCF
jgi:hypothetical protein